MNPFFSPSLGKLSLEGVIQVIKNYIAHFPEAFYRIVVGTDSERNHRGADFVTAILVHRVGKGGIYFWQRNHLIDNKFQILRPRIWQEALLSLETAGELLKKAKGLVTLVPESLEIHVDIGQGGPTREMIGEITSLIRANGFQAKIKPEAYGAATIADKHI